MKQNDKIKIIGEADIMPHDENTEKAVLATLMRHNEKFSEFAELLDEKIFYVEMHRKIYRCITGVIACGNTTDINSLCDYAKSNGINFVQLDKTIEEWEDKVNLHSVASIFGFANTQTLEQDIRRLRLLSQRREYWTILQVAAKNVLDPTIEVDTEINSCITNINNVHTDSNDGVASFSEALTELKETVDNNVSGKQNSLTTGFKIFDEHFLLRPTTLTVIAAFSGVGKTALAMNIAKKVASDGFPVAFYSKEMGKQELASRVISKDALMPSSIILNKKLVDWQMRDVEVAIERNKDLPIYIDERSTLTFDKTIASIRTLVKTKNIKLAVIDYLQIFAQSLTNNEADLGYMAREAKNVAKETKIPVIVLSQLNRSAPHPSGMMLRGSGQILESTDNLVLIDRPEANIDSNIDKYEGEFSDKSIVGTAKLILSKVRGGSPDVALVGFRGEYTQFYELNESSETTEANKPDYSLPSTDRNKDVLPHAPSAAEEDMPF